MKNIRLQEADVLHHRMLRSERIARVCAQGVVMLCAGAAFGMVFGLALLGMV